MALRLLAEHKPDRPLKTNVEYYASIVLDGVGLLTDLYACVRGRPNRRLVCACPRAGETGR